jgi:lysozyme
MRFNLGGTGFRKFKKMIAAINNNDFMTAALEMKNSKWFDQVGKRAKTLINMMLKVG